MRLLCPNCDAEYEVDAALIPDYGRDVQCSNCGHAWFQISPVVQAEADAEQALFAPSEGIADPTLPTGTQDDEENETPFAPPQTAAKARSIDASVLSVLREEAERESRARLSDGGNLEMQDELGLAGSAPGTETSSTPVAARIARLKGEAETHAASDLGLDMGPNTSTSRFGSVKRERLPEIDQINSTLRAKSERRSGDSGAVADTMGDDEKRGGFRRGFLMAMAVIILVLGLYMFAPLLIEKYPAMASPLRAYIGHIEGLRGLLDRMLQGAITQIRA